MADFKAGPLDAVSEFLRVNHTASEEITADNQQTQYIEPITLSHLREINDELSKGGKVSTKATKNILKHWHHFNQ